MSGCQSGGDLDADLQDIRLRQLAFPFELRLQGFAFQKRHGNKRDTLIFSHLIDVDNVVVFNGGGELGFPQKPVFSRSSRRDRRFHNFQGDLSFQVGVFGQKHHPHASHAKDLQNPECMWLHRADGRSL
mgnify:CR=1 FL=1